MRLRVGGANRPEGPGRSADGTYDPDNVDDVNGQPGIAGPDVFPVRIYPRDRYDNVASLKARAPPQLGRKELTTDDLKFIQRKQEAQQQAIFKQFVPQLFDTTNPAEAQLLSNVYPEYLDEKLGIIESRAELDARLAKLRLRGFPRDKEDMKLIFAIKSGRVPLPQGDLWAPSSWGVQKDQALSRGWFSNVKVLAPDQIDPTRNPWDMVMPGRTGLVTHGMPDTLPDPDYNFLNIEDPWNFRTGYSVAPSG